MKGNASDILKNEEVSIVAVKMLKEGHTDNDVIGNTCSFFIQLFTKTQIIILSINCYRLSGRNGLDENDWSKYQHYQFIGGLYPRWATLRNCGVCRTRKFAGFSPQTCG